MKQVDFAGSISGWGGSSGLLFEYWIWQIVLWNLSGVIFAVCVFELNGVRSIISDMLWKSCV